eukprot:GHVT01081025.1.p2 GENE.GHVT01081025.1~~GHVT01081025.1.p2  ORF type:complete len:443 (-),score=29.78 GHVT01081025.1:4271-5599(-)
MAWVAPDCIICTEPLVKDLAKPATCGHVFHSHCLTKWCLVSTGKVECPLCRKHITKKATVALNFELFPTGGDDGAPQSTLVQALQTKIVSLKTQQLEKDEAITKFKVLYENSQKECEKTQKLFETEREALRNIKCSHSHLKLGEKHYRQSIRELKRDLLKFREIQEFLGVIDSEYIAEQAKITLDSSKQISESEKASLSHHVAKKSEEKLKKVTKELEEQKRKWVTSNEMLQKERTTRLEAQIQVDRLQRELVEATSRLHSTSVQPVKPNGPGKYSHNSVNSGSSAVSSARRPLFDPSKLPKLENSTRIQHGDLASRKRLLGHSGRDSLDTESCISPRRRVKRSFTHSSRASPKPGERSVEPADQEVSSAPPEYRDATSREKQASSPSIPGGSSALGMNSEIFHLGDSLNDFNYSSQLEDCSQPYGASLSYDANHPSNVGSM